MDINHISVSRKKCYDTCAQQYKFRYHIKVQMPGPEAIYFVYGKIIHKIAEEYVRCKGERTIGEISQDVVKGRIEVEPGKKAGEIDSSYKNKFPKHLHAIQKLTDKLGFDGELEYPFYYDLDKPNEKFIKGFIDRLIIKNDKAFIIDYKTTKKGKWRVNKNNVKQDLQLRMYARIVQKEFGIPAENIKACLFYLEGEEVVGTTFSEASLALVEAELKDAYIEIQETDADKVWGRVGWHCKNCDYNTICQFYKPTSPDAVWDGDMNNIPGMG